VAARQGTGWLEGVSAVVRPLSEEEIAGLLARDVVARFATVDADGYRM